MSLTPALLRVALRLRSALVRAARAPVVQFAVLGGALFALAPRREDPRHVEVPSASLATFERAQAAREGAQTLSPERAREIDARAIEDEVLAREAMRLGLDRDDPIVRQRLIQKLLLLVEDMGGASRPPSDAELRDYFAANRSRFMLPSRVHLVHVFATRREALPPADALDPRGVPAAGEPFPYPRDVRASREDLARVYGESFATAAFGGTPSEAWSAPVASSFGWHRVRVVEHEDARAPGFEEVKGALALDYALDKRAAVVGDYLKKTVGQYKIDVDGKPLVGFVPTHRIASRSDPSAED